MNVKYDVHDFTLNAALELEKMLKLVVLYIAISITITITINLLIISYLNFFEFS